MSPKPVALSKTRVRRGARAPNKAADVERVAQIFERFAVANPEPKGELEHVNPYTLLVAVVLSAQATDAGVNKATRGLFKLAATPQQMLTLGLDDLQRQIKTIGLYRNKAKNVMALSRQLIAEHGGEVPRQREALEALPGVGRKTANVVLNIAFDESTLAVDTHVFRVAHRLGLAKGKTPLDVELALLGLIPTKYLRHAHHWLILHGRYICRARKPRCDACVVCDLCFSQDKWFDCGQPGSNTAKGAART
ncbi:MAG TPA: endonuclease III [Hyphomicrobiaceae bacterium]|nr:endonuclease III [Hyphomicrobiaceae bacterium]